MKLHIPRTVKHKHITAHVRPQLPGKRWTTQAGLRLWHRTSDALQPQASGSGRSHTKWEQPGCRLAPVAAAAAAAAAVAVAVAVAAVVAVVAVVAAVFREARSFLRKEEMSLTRT